MWMQDVVVVVVAATVVFILHSLQQTCCRSVIWMLTCLLMFYILRQQLLQSFWFWMWHVVVPSTKWEGGVHRRNNSVPIFRHIEFWWCKMGLPESFRHIEFLMMQMGLPESVGKRCSGLLFFSWGVMANGIAVRVGISFCLLTRPQRFCLSSNCIGPLLGLPAKWVTKLKSIQISTITVIFSQLAQLDVIATNFFFHSSSVH